MKLSTKLYIGGATALVFTPFTFASLLVVAGGLYAQNKLSN